MSNLADEIARQMASKQLDQVQLAELSGISQSQISRWLSSTQLSVSPEQLSNLAPALSDDATDHAALVRAHLMDERVGPGSELVTVEIEHPNMLRDRPKPRSKGERALVFLAAERLRNRELNDLLIDLARLLGASDTKPNSDDREAVALAKQISDSDAAHKGPGSRSPSIDRQIP